MSLVDRAHGWLLAKPRRADLAALVTLTLLWALFFWRALTPNPADQVSLPEGDFSGQFVAFGAYQARRLLAGQVPLWNPYNFAGHPFLADTQSAVFYPPRLVTIFVSPAFGGWSYAALQAEALAHFWLASLLTYLFVRTITNSRLAGLVGGLTLAYGGYLTGYPPLQLAVLEAGVWLPLALLGVYKASERPKKWRIEWLALGSLALGLSLLAGHPQTSLFFTYALVAYIVHRAARTRLLDALLALGLTLAGGYGLAMIQVLPGLEYARLTTRADLGYQALSGGFPLRDLAIFLVPNVFTVWSPLYSGVAGLVLAALSVWRGEDGARFWAIVALVALGLSFGGGTLLYPLAYLVVPGFSWFRGQERAAYLVAHSVAIMAGLGAANMLRWEAEQGRRFVRSLGWASGAAWAFAAIALACACSPINEARPSLSEGAIFLAVLVTLTWALTGLRLRGLGGRAWMPLLVGLVVFDLFSNDMRTNFEPVPLAERDLTGPLVDAALDYQRQAGLMRVDGWAGLGGNGGTLVGLQDIRGISPLRLAALDGYFGLPLYRLHQLLAVELVFTDWQQLEVPSQVIAEARDSDPPLYLHRIEEPMPRAWLAFEVAIVSDDAQALGLLADPAFDVRRTVLLADEPPLEMPSQPPDEWRAEVINYQPESIVVQTEADTSGLLVLSELYYPGWRATLDGEPTHILRADAGLRAVAVPAGEHVVTMVYHPTSFYVGAGVSLATMLALAVFVWRSSFSRAAERDD